MMGIIVVVGPAVGVGTTVVGGMPVVAPEPGAVVSAQVFMMCVQQASVLGIPDEI